MQLVILIMVNIFIAAIFYLIISLKLERSATEFRSKRLRKEMEDLINEFNHTAERNLALLEYKINVLRELLKHADALPSIDLRIDEDPLETMNGPKAEKKIRRKKEPQSFSDLPGMQNGVSNEQIELLSRKTEDVHDNAHYKNMIYLSTDKNNNAEQKTQYSPTVKEQLAAIFGIAYKRGKDYLHNWHMRRQKKTVKDFQRSENDIHADYHENVTKELSPEPDIPLLRKNIQSIDENTLAKMYEDAENKYVLIAQLYSQGYSPAVLSKISGIPIGEISLIVNLTFKK